MKKPILLRDSPTGSNLFLSSPLLFTAGSRVTGLVAEKGGGGDDTLRGSGPQDKSTSMELGCRAALKEVGVPEDHSVYKNLPKFPSLDPGSSSVAPAPSTKVEAPSEVATTEATSVVTDATQSEADANIGATD
ncbi:hypothetical protein CKAN_00831600 [Cinnamomum micranthum f. kanehirae]|uniref:Uncharacterized protein n=1 Tax=Cinnamomum micranthum f. kanehirae TaxID=337451 RepID=A0A443NMI1_9MAGN|nr:hypothetical protein CKAN_00831600 [Cinnamomum micranthum f. kanehirae]